MQNRATGHRGQIIPFPKRDPDPNCINPNIYLNSLMEVESSNIKAIGCFYLPGNGLADADFDDKACVVIKFKNGTAYSYLNVKREHFVGLRDSGSKGAYFAAHFKNEITHGYQATKLKEIQ